MLIFVLRNQRKVMEKLNRGDKIYLDKEKTKESAVNSYLECRDGIVECIEYRDCSGYGSHVRLFKCTNAKHEFKSIIRQTSVGKDEWVEDDIQFDSDSFKYLELLLDDNPAELIKQNYSVVRTY